MAIAEAQFSGADQFFGLVGPKVTDYTKPKITLETGSNEAAKTSEKTSFTAKQVFGFILNLCTLFIPYLIARGFVNKKITLQKDFEFKEALKPLNAQFAEVKEAEKNFLDSWKEKNKARVENKFREFKQALFKIRHGLTSQIEVFKELRNELANKEPTYGDKISTALANEIQETKNMVESYAYQTALKSEKQELKKMGDILVTICDKQKAVGLSYQVFEDIEASFYSKKIDYRRDELININSQIDLLNKEIAQLDIEYKELYERACERSGKSTIDSSFKKYHADITYTKKIQPGFIFVKQTCSQRSVF